MSQEQVNNSDWLDNSYPCNVLFEGDMYPSAENAYQASKTMWCDHPEFFRCSPAEARKKGELGIYNTDRCEQRNRKAIRSILWDKFTRNADLKVKLLETGSKILETKDGYGKLLMEIRSGLRGLG